MKKLTTQQFIEKAKQVHGNTYNYSKVVYTNQKTKIIIICGTHGEWQQTPNNHLNGQRCPKCFKPLHSIDSILAKANTVHKNKYTYEKLVFNTVNDKGIITCPVHGEWEQVLSNHLTGQGCPECSKYNPSSLSKFIERSKKVHNNFYIYDKTTFTNNKVKTIITCPVHGDFEQRPDQHVSGRGCYPCSLLTKGWGRSAFEGKPSILYCLELPNNLYKVGITSQKSVSKRYPLKVDRNLIKNILCEVSLEGGIAYDYEKAILKYYKDYSYKGPSILSCVGISEILTTNPIKHIQKLTTGNTNV